MGCGYSNTKVGEVPVKAIYSKSPDSARVDKKHQKINGRLHAEGGDKMYENVKLVEGEAMNRASEEKILQILKHHFFFYGLSNLERSQVVKKMVQCRTDAGNYVFKQGDLATAFFIIAEGRVQVQITGEKKRTLQKGDYFGELALIYMAPRSASIKALIPTQFWCITRNTFRQTVEEYVKKNYAIAKEYVDKFPLFASLTEKQRDSVAYNMLTLKYQNEQVIFKINDDANSFFIVTKGSVEINIPNKNKLLLGVGESFGEQSFIEQQVRGGTAIARQQTVCLSIGRDVIKNLLGDRIYNISNYNIAKWALKRSQILTKLSNVQTEKILETVEFRSYEDKEIVFKKGDAPKFIVIPIEGSVEDKSHGQIAGEHFLNYSQGQTIDKDYLKIGKGSVAVISFENITRITSSKTTQLMNACENTYEKEMELNTRKTVDYSHITLDNLIHLKKLGQGQFGRVYLVRQSKSSPNMYALKCIKKQQVISHRMEKIILEEKRILSQINFPLAVSFVKSFKDNHFIYLLMEYVKGFELFDIIREIGILSKGIGRFYMSSLVLSIEYLHLKNIIYRDLKPENVMVENDGHLKLIDMGTAKKLTSNKGFRTFTMIGTPHYMAPEVMQGKGYSFAADIWSLGVVMYEFLCGELPFANKLEEPHQIHKCILQSNVEYPSFFTDEKAKKLIGQLLNKTPELRLPKGFPSLKANPYFDGVNWQDVYSKKMKSPYIPKQAKMSEKPIPDGGLLLNVMLKQKAKLGICKQSAIHDWDAQF